MITEDKAAEKAVKVRVSDRWQVTHDGKRYLKGDSVSVPESIAAEWVRRHWVERVGK